MAPWNSFTVREMHVIARTGFCDVDDVTGRKAADPTGSVFKRVVHSCMVSFLYRGCSMGRLTIWRCFCLARRASSLFCLVSSDVRM